MEVFVFVFVSIPTLGEIQDLLNISMISEACHFLMIETIIHHKWHSVPHFLHTR